jgi:hypothetical protein
MTHIWIFWMQSGVEIFNLVSTGIKFWFGGSTVAYYTTL